MKTRQDILADALQEVQACTGARETIHSVEDLGAALEALSNVVQRRVGEVVSLAVRDNATDQLRTLGFDDTEIATLMTLTPSQAKQVFTDVPLPLVTVSISETLLALCIDMINSSHSIEAIEAALASLENRVVLNPPSTRKH